MKYVDEFCYLDKAYFVSKDERQRSGAVKREARRNSRVKLVIGMQQCMANKIRTNKVN